MSKRHMTIETNDFQSRLRVLLGLHGAVLTDEELSHTAERYPRCRGKGHWDVREYVRRTGVGAREYRVVRGSGIEDVYRSVERVRAAAIVYQERDPASVEGASVAMPLRSSRP